MSIKCLGRSPAQRWLAVQLELYRRQSATERARGRLGIATFHAVAVDEGADAIARRVTTQPSPKQVVASIRSLEGLANRLDEDARLGADLLEEEEALLATFRKALTILRAWAALGHRQALASEESAFGKKITNEELAASDLFEGSQVLASAMAGVEIGDAVDREAMLVRFRTSESQEFLRQARIWNLETYEDVRASPESERARLRGDMILERARDTSKTLVYRDAALHAAQRYYAFGGFEAEAAVVASEGESISAVLQADEARRQQKLEEAKANLREEVGSLHRAVDELEKSAAEKQSFEDEAKAMEEELGF
jgi:hypothetical protein